MVATASSQLVIHTPGSRSVDRAELGTIPTPPRTDTYTPVPFGDLADFTERTVTEITGLDIHDRAFGLSRADQCFFGVLTCRVGNDHLGLSIGVRSSHNKRLKVQFISGAKTFVCDNMAFVGQSARLVRKHQGDVWAGIKSRLEELLAAAPNDFATVLDLFKRLREVEITTNHAAALVGRARFDGVLTATQAELAYNEIRDPTYPEFKDPTAENLLQHLTHAVKKGQGAGYGVQSGLLHRSASVVEWFQQREAENFELTLAA